MYNHLQCFFIAVLSLYVNNYIVKTGICLKELNFKAISHICAQGSHLQLLHRSLCLCNIATETTERVIPLCAGLPPVFRNICKHIFCLSLFLKYSSWYACMKWEWHMDYICQESVYTRKRGMISNRQQIYRLCCFSLGI